MNKKYVAITSIMTLGFLVSCSHNNIPKVDEVVSPSNQVIETKVVDNTQALAQAEAERELKKQEELLAQKAEEKKQELLAQKQEQEKIAAEEEKAAALKAAQQAEAKKALEEAAQEEVAKAAAEAPQILSSWNFQTVQVGTSGSVQFIKKWNTQTIQISNLNTSAAPNLEIYLSKASSISNSGGIPWSIKLTALKSPKWTQTYSVPSHIDLSQYNSIAIHCTEYNKLFGSASLK